jgi:hypothetical protein
MNIGREAQSVLDDQRKAIIEKCGFARAVRSHERKKENFWI